MTQSVSEFVPSRAGPQPWLCSASFDLVFIAAPAFLSSLLALAFKEQFEGMPSLPLWAWVSFVLLIDVAHVYATLFRTYLNPAARAKNGTLLTAIPLACWAAGTMIYSIDGLLFWRLLAYLAVFHFVRQQYGFVALYSRKDSLAARKFRRLDEACVYLATLYPLMFWHTNLPRNFNWFVEGDFISNLPLAAAPICLALYVAAALSYAVKELIFFKQDGYFNIPKNLIVLGTALSWWVAIVAINSDMSFTMVNVVSHGVPYMALVWLYHRLKGRNSGNFSAARSFDSGGNLGSRVSFRRFLDFFLRVCLSFAPVFVLFLCLLAYMEEGLWDGFIWREHLGLFRPFACLPVISDRSVLAVLVPLLSLPQSTHYVLDGFIWRVKDRSSIWSAFQG